MHQVQRHCLATFLALLAIFSFAPQTRAEDSDDTRALRLGLGRTFDLPGSPVLLALANSRRLSVAVELESSWKEYLAGKGTTAFLIQRLARFRDAVSAMSDQPEVRLFALEQHLRHLLVCEEIEQARLDAGRVSFHQFRFAVADAKFCLAEAIVAHGHTKQPLSKDLLERQWLDLGSRDVARACRARWTLQAAGCEAEEFLRRQVEAVPVPSGESRELIAVSDGLGEVLRESARAAAVVLGEKRASKERRLLRALELLEEMDKVEGR